MFVINKRYGCSSQIRVGDKLCLYKEKITYSKVKLKIYTSKLRVCYNVLKTITQNLYFNSIK